MESQARLLQGYLVADERITVRVRVTGNDACLTIKGATAGAARSEYEYPIPVQDAETLLRELAVAGLVEKVRYRVRCGDHVWDLDLFEGENRGLALAEVELRREDESFQMPDWAGEEVTGDARYYNASLARHPFSRWQDRP